MAEIEERKLVPVFGIGASAGGLEALEAVLRGASSDFPAAIVVVQHLPPDHPTLTADLIAKHTDLRVVRAESTLELVPGTVYFIEPKSLLGLAGNSLLVSHAPERPQRQRPIDIFFEALAAERGGDALVAILSGTGNDGTRGARAIKEEGGFVIIQAPESARFDGMPRSILGAKLCDLALLPDEILPRARMLLKTPLFAESGQNGSFHGVLRVLEEKEDINVRAYREATLRRRVERRIVLTQSASVEDYERLVQCDADERTTLINDLFIGVTRFFRDPEGYLALEQALHSGTGETQFRVWVCACSTGEEAYSIGMLLTEYFETRGGRDFKIFATDISPAAIRHASRGVYSADLMGNVSPERQARFFRRGDDGNFSVDQSLRRRVVFSEHDALRDPPFSRMNLVVCRNMLIYLQPAAQERLVAHFNFSLLEGGLLWLGPSESAADRTNGFDTIDSRWKIFRAVARPKRPNLEWKLRAPGPGNLQKVAVVPVLGARNELDWQRLHEEASAGYLPSHLIVNEEFRILFQIGPAARSLLTIPEGQATTDLRLLICPSVRAVAESLISEARAGADTALDNLLIPELGKSVHLRARALVANRGLVILFVTYATEDLAIEDARVLKLGEIEAILQRRVEVLEYEIQLSRESLQTTVEELESSNEELLSTNAELLASNEELHSVNEELQSVNEELYTINSEHQQKIAELRTLNLDLDSLLATVEHAVLFLDAELCIRRFNPRATDFVALVEGDIGRPFSHFTHRLDEFPFLDLCARVLREQIDIERVATVQAGAATVLVRLGPLASRDGELGVVISITDVTTVERLRENHSRFLAALDTVDLPIALLSLDGKIEYANHSLALISGRDARFLQGSEATSLVDPSFAEIWRAAVLRTLGGKNWEGYLRMQRPDGTTVNEHVRLSPTFSGTGLVKGIVRLTLVSSDGSNATKEPEAFFFPGNAGNDSDIATMQTLVHALAAGRRQRTRALSTIVEPDRPRIELALDELDRQEDGARVELSFSLLTSRQRFGVNAVFERNGPLLQGSLTGVTWQSRDQNQS